MTDQEFEECHKNKRYIVVSRHEHSDSTLEELVDRAMRFGFRPHGSMLIPKPRSFFQATTRDSIESHESQAIPSAQERVDSWNRRVEAGASVIYEKSAVEGRIILKAVRPAYVLGDEAVVELEHIGKRCSPRLARFSADPNSHRKRSKFVFK